MLLGLISELRSNPHICMLPSSMAAYRQMFLANIDARIVSEFHGQKKSSFVIKASVDEQGNPFMTRDYVGNGETIKYYRGLSPEDRLINVVRLCGPMTRGGEACSYGSMELRDQIMEVAQYPQCKGHIIYCNTPGGMASCLPDFRMAINYAHDHGQQVWMLIDGQCASGGAFTSALCDKVFCTNLEDEIGSIGMYCAFFTLADGAENKITSEVYHECYATRSEHKNEWYRAAADGNMKLVEEETNADLDVLIANLLADRPSIKEDQCTGSMYKCRDVIGSLIDGQSSIEQMATELLADFEQRNGAPIPHKDGASAQTASPEPPAGDPSTDPEPPVDDPSNDPEPPADDPDGAPAQSSASTLTEHQREDALASSASDPASISEGSATPASPQTSNSPTMKTFTSIPAAIGEEPMEVLEDGMLTLQGGQAEALEAFLANHQSNEQALADANATIATQQQTITETQQSLDAANATIADLQSQLAALQQQMTDAQTAHETAMTEANTAHETAIAALNTDLAAARQQVNDLTAEVASLNAAQGQQPQAGSAPATTGQQPQQQPKLIVNTRYNRNMTAKQLAELYAQR